MKYFIKNPKARGFYRSRWAAAWAKMLNSGAVSSDEEETMRIEILQKEAGVTSSNDLTEKGYTAVMLHLGSILGEGEKQMRDPERARKIYKINAIATKLRPADPDSYVRGILDDMGCITDPALWRTGLLWNDLHKLMLTMITQERREARKAVGGGQEAVGGGQSAEEAGV
jgi:hypothetical protein